MFDDINLDAFKFYADYYKLITTKLVDLYDDFSEAELAHKTKCVLAILQAQKPTMGDYYLRAYINDAVEIYTRWNTNDQLTSFSYFVLNDNLTINQNKLNELSYTNCTTENFDTVLTLIQEAFKTLIGYEAPNNPVSELPLIIR